MIFDHYKNGERLYTRMVFPVCYSFHVTYMEFTVLMFLNNHPQYDTASEIVNIRHLTKSHVSVSVKSLLEKGLLEEFYEKNNNKTKHLKITKAAQPIVKEGLKAQKDFADILSEGFTQEETEQWFAMLQKIDSNINKYLSE